MRTVTFSDKEVQRKLKKDFVLAWMNLEGDRAAGSSIAHPPKDPAPPCTRGNGKSNVQLLVLTPKGEIVNAMSGYQGPDDLLEELEFALDLVEGLDTTSEETIEKTLVKPHLAFAEELEEREFEGFLGDFIRRQVLSDHRFVAKNPLLHVEDFRTEMLAGKGISHFSSSSGGKEKGPIGGDRPSTGGKGSKGGKKD